MNNNDRRDFIKQGLASIALLCTPTQFNAKNRNSEVNNSTLECACEWPFHETELTPKIVMTIGSNADIATIRRVKQIGVNQVLISSPRIPWSQNEINEVVSRFEAFGLKIGNIMLPGQSPLSLATDPTNKAEKLNRLHEFIYQVGESTIPVIEYNWYARRLLGGYYEEIGRGGAGYMAFDYERVRNVQALPGDGIHSSAELWERLHEFLESVIPVAKECNVRFALHPNDPPVPVSHQSDQIMATVEDWKRLVALVDSPENGITFDCGVTMETGEDPVEVCEWFASRDRINHVHYRNVIPVKPREKYYEVFPDNGHVDMYKVMKSLIENRYRYTIWPEHERALDYDRERGIRGMYADVGGGGYAGLTYNIAYTRGMLQSVMSQGFS